MHTTSCIGCMIFSCCFIFVPVNFCFLSGHHFYINIFLSVLSCPFVHENCAFLCPLPPCAFLCPLLSVFLHDKPTILKPDADKIIAWWYQMGIGCSTTTTVLSFFCLPQKLVSWKQNLVLQKMKCILIY